MNSSPVDDSETLPGWQKLNYAGHWHGKTWTARRETDGLEANLEFIALNEEMSDRLIERLATVAGVRHPNLLGVLFTERYREGLVVATPAVDYRLSLTHRQKQSNVAGKGPIPAGELLQYVVMAADGIEYLNNRCNCPHKNINPDNMLVLGETLKLTRYGYPDACDLVGQFGAQFHIAPERYFGAAANAKSDLYALAIVYFELRTGVLPLFGNRRKAMPCPDESDLIALPESERSIVAKAVKAKPEERWSSCREFVIELENALGRDNVG
jgi:serine/threonine protein kinase